MFKQIQDYFDFNRAERTSIVILGAVLIVLFFIPAFLRHNRKTENADFKSFENEITAFEKSLVYNTDTSGKSPGRQIDFEHVDRSIAEQELTPFPFNPNEMTPENWRRLGLKEWQVKIITNYTIKGGKFFKKEDLQKIYGISRSQYEVLAPYINIPEREYLSKRPGTRNPEASYTKLTIVDLNSADSATLVTLNGVGPSFARRIIKFRGLLGGFYSTSQLLEVYGFDSARYEKVVRYCKADPSGIKKINLNAVTTDELRKHPYFDYYLAKAIVDRRIIGGNYTSIDQVAQLSLVHSDLFNKIKYYLALE